MDEIDNPKSCWNKAGIDERLFILLRRDKVAPEVIRYWAYLRVVKGMNKTQDPQIQEALQCAELMEYENGTKK